MDSRTEYLDNQLLDSLIFNIEESSMKLNIGDEIFSNEENSLGTESMMELSSYIHVMQQITDKYKCQIQNEALPLIRETQANINKADLSASMSINGLGR